MLPRALPRPRRAGSRGPTKGKTPLYGVFQCAERLAALSFEEPHQPNVRGLTERARDAYAGAVRRVEAAVGSGIFLFAAPGVVAGLVPWLLTGWHSTGPPTVVAALGAFLIGVGGAVLLIAFARFVTEGRGTPAPIAPTERLVVGGLYRHVRNPMYVAVGATIVGQALLLGRPLLLVYAALFWLVVAAFVYGYEEPTLSARYGEEYAAYRHAVRAWWPRLRPWHGES
jgi:protein-S-isoprenylcysteine O-methyltransferase Ste14